MRKDGKKSALSLAFSFAGCFLGAGYVSGKELWQYFGAYGAKGLAGAVASIALLGAVCALLMVLSRRAGSENMDEILLRRGSPAARSAVGFIMAFLVFGIVCIMASGIGAMFLQYFSVPAKLGSFAAVVLIAAVAYFGVDGMIKMFSVSVPVLVLAAVVISIAGIVRPDTEGIRFTAEAANPLLGNWLFASVNYASLNFVASIAILVPLASAFENKRTIAAGIFTGCVFLLAIALCIIFALAASPVSVEKELPMLFIAQSLGRIPGLVYTLLMFLGMMGTSVSSFVAVCVYAEQKSTWISRHRLAFIAALSVIAYAVSCAGFGNLIASVYPLYGYIGFVTIVLVLEHLLYLKRNGI